MRFPILLPNIFDYPFTYESNINLKVGDYVLVPFGKSKITGVVWNEFEKKKDKKFKIKKIIKKLDVAPLKKNTINFMNWFSEYNIIPRGMTLKLLLLSSNAIENKKSQLSDIIKSTEKEEDQLLSKKKKAEKGIDSSLVDAYASIRSSSKNGLSVVKIDRDACGGCFSSITAQHSLNIRMRKEIYFCENCGRILVPDDIDSK